MHLNVPASSLFSASVCSARLSLTWFEYGLDLQTTICVKKGKRTLLCVCTQFRNCLAMGMGRGVPHGSWLDTAALRYHHHHHHHHHHQLRRRGRTLPVLAWLAPWLLALQTGPSSFFSSLDTSRYREKKLVDRVVVQARAGNGGYGCASVRKGRTGKVFADGGNGGDGGDVVVRACRNVKSLVGLPQLLVSKHGGHGSSKKQHGRRGADGVYLVPLGTQVRRFLERGREAPVVVTEGFREGGGDAYERRGAYGDDADDEEVDEDEDEDGVRQRGAPNVPMMIDLSLEEEEGDSFPSSSSYGYVGDLVKDGDSVVVAKGGAGGRGNVGMGRQGHGHQSDHGLGEFARLELEMKMISDLSLVGFPNVGKSSVLRQLSSAMPKVGSYAFTTTTPQLGSVSVGGDGPRFVVADVPGLIQGAHENRGVGHTFLKHVERAGAIVYVLDASGAYALDGSEEPLSPQEQLVRLREELEYFDEALLEKQWMIVLNKMDLVRGRRRVMDGFRAWVAGRYGEVPVVCVSALAPETRAIDRLSNLAETMHRMLEGVR